MGFALMTSACDPSTPSEVSAAKIQVRDRAVTEILTTDHVDKASVQAIAAKILHNGDKVDVTLTVPYLSSGYAAAVKLGNAYKSAFAKEGVTHFSVALVQMTDSKDTGKAVVSYQGLVASQPDGCKLLPGSGHQGTGTMEDAQGYQYGCETQANLSKMIADPSDLLGKSPVTAADSNRNGPLAETFLSGKPNGAMGGMSASSGK
jgi:type IV pilus biogenesis protein CpaD/CtpE